MTYTKPRPERNPCSWSPEQLAEAREIVQWIVERYVPPPAPPLPIRRVTLQKPLAEEE